MRSPTRSGAWREGRGRRSSLGTSASLVCGSAAGIHERGDERDTPLSQSNCIAILGGSIPSPAPDQLRVPSSHVVVAASPVSSIRARTHFIVGQISSSFTVSAPGSIALELKADQCSASMDCSR